MFSKNRRYSESSIINCRPCKKLGGDRLMDEKTANRRTPSHHIYIDPDERCEEQTEEEEDGIFSPHNNWLVYIAT